MGSEHLGRVFSAMIPALKSYTNPLGNRTDKDMKAMTGTWNLNSTFTSKMKKKYFETARQLGLCTFSKQKPNSPCDKSRGEGSYGVS